jgi:hypothetical protein
VRRLMRRHLLSVRSNPEIDQSIIKCGVSKAPAGQCPPKICPVPVKISKIANSLKNGLAVVGCALAHCFFQKTRQVSKTEKFSDESWMNHRRTT